MLAMVSFIKSTFMPFFFLFHRLLWSDKYYNNFSYIRRSWKLIWVSRLSDELISLWWQEVKKDTNLQKSIRTYSSRQLQWITQCPSHTGESNQFLGDKNKDQMNVFLKIIIVWWKMYSSIYQPPSHFSVSKYMLHLTLLMWCHLYFSSYFHTL